MTSYFTGPQEPYGRERVKLAVISTSVVTITFVVAEITFRMVVITSSVVETTFVAI